MVGVARCQGIERRLRGTNILEHVLRVAAPVRATLLALAGTGTVGGISVQAGQCDTSKVGFSQRRLLCVEVCDDTQQVDELLEI